MGVYINMEMPESCIKCKLCVSYKCVPTGEIRWSDEFDYDSKRFENCPLVPVPEHGRLIDADALTISTAVPLDGKPYQYVHIDNIDAAPTIIPAEEET